MAALWPELALIFISLWCLFLRTSFAQPGLGLGASPNYRGRDACPERCSIAGPNPSNWSLYHNFDEHHSCSRAIFYEFSLYDEVDKPDSLHRIYACASHGTDWANLPNVTKITPALVPAEGANATYEIGVLPDGTLATNDIRSLSNQMGNYLANGYGVTNNSVVLFAKSGKASAGLYIGKGLQNEGTSSFALKALYDAIPTLEINGGTLAMQLCNRGDDGDHIFGFIATSNATFSPIQNAMRSWSNAECLSLQGAKNIVGPAFFTTPSIISNNITNSTTSSKNPMVNSLSKRARTQLLSPRADCRTIQVISGNGCAALAARCKISGADFTKYNPGKDFCSKLQPLQHVCCSAGTLPDFTPKPNKDGSCHAYTVKNNDNCASIAAGNSLTVEKLISYNKNTWAWNGCSDLWVGTIICLSSGTPPMPAIVANAVCGPQKPGTTKPPASTDISTLNPCPLNACCDVWGQCGITSEFCVDTGTGTPGTAKTGTNGCISNCGTKIVRSAPPSKFRNVAYFEGFNLGRKCLNQDTLQLNASQYTNLHFAFGTLTSNYEVKVGDALSAYEFKSFKLIQGPAKILSFGGWNFSTDPSTYNIFRQGTTAANRMTMATNIANFIKANNLDGVDIDWEYPGAPDIPGIPAGSPDEGANYLAFLTILKNLLPGKSVSIAAPSSYWYLRGFPIAKISNVVDYIIFMTYDLHGQWDAGNQYSQVGCPSGSCLRSNVNLTETNTALAMITKAGVPSNKVVVGVTSYGRSFAMAQAGCHTEQCQFTGTKSQSNAAKGPCTDVAGYISDAEIKNILSNSSRVNYNYVDQKSNTNVIVYDNTQWVGWMSPEIKTTRKALYRQFNMGGATDWAADLEDYHNPPVPSKSWTQFKNAIMNGEDPEELPHSGNWTTVQCTDPSITDILDLTPKQRWTGLDGNDAWKDVIRQWKTVDEGRTNSFTYSASNTIHGPQNANCSSLRDDNNCDESRQCKEFVTTNTGAAGYELWNSFIVIHDMYSTYYHALTDAMAKSVDPTLNAFENTFAPVPPKKSDLWLQILLDVVGFGASVAAAGFFDEFLGGLEFFRLDGGDLLRDVTYAAVNTGTIIAKDLAAGERPDIWTPEDQDAFSDYIGQVGDAWGKTTEHALGHLFDGTDDAINILSLFITDGKMIEGKDSPTSVPQGDVEDMITRALFAYAVPAVWNLTSIFPFVVDSGHACGTSDPPRMSPETKGVCYNGTEYYLASPKGAPETCFPPPKDCVSCTSTCKPNTFSSPPGVESLPFHGLKLEDLIIGSLHSYEANGNQNGGGNIDPSNLDTIDQIVNRGITAPGYIRMPVCSADMAYNAWNAPTGPETDKPNYPCSPVEGKSDCGSSTFVDQTSDASPLVSDCLEIVKNIQGTDDEHEVENAIGAQHGLEQYGTCAFGVQGEGKNGNVNFYVGGQDIVDLINDSVKQFGGSGKIGAKGDMSCKGDAKDQNVEWGIYHTK